MEKLKLPSAVEKNITDVVEKEKTNREFSKNKEK